MPSAKQKFRGVRRWGSGYQLDFKDKKGIRHRPTLQNLPESAANLNFARDFLGEVRRKIRKGEFNFREAFPDAKHQGVGDIKTVAQLLDVYLEHDLETIDQKVPSVLKEWKNRKRHAEKLKLGLGQIYVSMLAPADVTKYLSGPKFADIANKTKNNTFIVLRNAYRYACENHLIVNNPIAALRNYKLPKTDPQFLTPDEIEKVLRVLDKTMRGQARIFYAFAFATGLSTSEQLGLRWEEVDFETRKLRVRRAIVEADVTGTKNTIRWRTIDILRPAYLALLAQRRHTGHLEWVFQNEGTGKVWSVPQLTKVWGDALEKLGISYRRPYTTRHTYASLLYTANAGMAWIKEQMGHTNSDMLDTRYARWIESQKESVANWVRRKCGAPENVQSDWPPQWSPSSALLRRAGLSDNTPRGSQKATKSA